MQATTYLYDELNRLTQVSYDDGGTIDYTYDGAGNRLTETVSVVPVFRLTGDPVSLRAPIGGSAQRMLTVTPLNRKWLS